MDIPDVVEEERVHLSSGRSTWGLMCYEGVHGDERGMLRIREANEHAVSERAETDAFGSEVRSEREAGNGDESEKVGLGNLRGVPSQLQAVGGKQEEAWRARRCRGVPPLPIGRGRR